MSHVTRREFLAGSSILFTSDVLAALPQSRPCLPETCSAPSTPLKSWRRHFSRATRGIRSRRQRSAPPGKRCLIRIASCSWKGGPGAQNTLAGIAGDTADGVRPQREPIEL